MLFRVVVLAALTAFSPGSNSLYGWGFDGHRLVSQLALAALPPDEFPRFVQSAANQERIAFLSGEPDRWRNVPDLPLKHAGGSWLDHFLDLEFVTEAGLDLATLTPFRYEFAVQYAAGRAANADKFTPVDPAKNVDRTEEWPGFAPWAITEAFGRLRSAFSYLKVFEELGTADEVLNAEANVVYLMGVMAHNIADCSQPLHTTKHHDGWVGENPKGFRTEKGFHSFIDSGVAPKAGITLHTLRPRVQPAGVISLAPAPDGRDPMFVAVMNYLMASNAQVAPLYRLEREKKLGSGPEPVSEEGKRFIEERLLEGARMIAAVWLTAYRSAVPDTKLRAALIRQRTMPATPAAK